MADILSVGIDIGTSTTQLVFSRISMKNTVGFFSVPHVEIVEKEVLYKSPVYTTPLRSSVLIDSDAVRDIVEKEYAAAGHSPRDVDTGAVIITGESARKDNAAAVLERLSAFAGDFVVSTAGPDLESVIAGKGSGAWRYSRDHHCVTANLDIGGGTTNIVIFDDGEVVSKGCYDIGGRLIRLRSGGGDWIVESVSEAARIIAESAGIRLWPGDRTDVRTLKRITDIMADLLAQALGILPGTLLLDAVRTAESTRLMLPEKPVGNLYFSGGIADFIYGTGRDTGEGPVPFGDIGLLLGASLLEGELIRRVTVMKGAETIRATVVGAGTYATTISGSTIAYADSLFPVKNVPVLRLTAAEQEACFSGHAGFLSEKVRWFLEQNVSEKLVLAMPGKQDPSFEELQTLADYLAEELNESLPPGGPVLIVLEQDMAKALGVLLERALRNRRRLACIDGIRVEENDYVDMGRPLMNGLVVPVVIKTLLFG